MTGVDPSYAKKASTTFLQAHALPCNQALPIIEGVEDLSPPAASAVDLRDRQCEGLRTDVDTGVQTEIVLVIYEQRYPAPNMFGWTLGPN